MRSESGHLLWDSFMQNIKKTILEVHKQQMVTLLSNRAGTLVTNGMEKAEVFSAFFASVSTRRANLQGILGS